MAGFKNFLLFLGTRLGLKHTKLKNKFSRFYWQVEKNLFEVEKIINERIKHGYKISKDIRKL